MTDHTREHERARGSERAGGPDRGRAGTAETSGTEAGRAAPGPTDDGGRDGDAGPGRDRFGERLRAVERALTGTDEAVADLADGAGASAEREELGARLDDLEARVEELEAATQAIRGYVGSIRSVNREVERRADLALAKATGGAAAEAADADTPHGDAAGPDGAPSETALDAAVPPNHRRESDGGAEGPIDRAEADGEGGGESWYDDTLDRLRDGL